MVRPRFRLRASSFRHRPKGTKGRLRGSASGSASAPKGGALLTVGPPPKNPRKGYGGVSRGAVSSFRRASSTLPATHGGLRPFAQVTCHPVSRLWAPVFGVQACGAAPLTAHAPQGYVVSGGLGGGIAKAYGCTGPQAVGGTGAAASPGCRKERNAVQLSGGIPKGALPLGRTFGDFSCVRKVTPAERPAARRRRNLLGVWGYRPQKAPIPPGRADPAGRLFRCGTPGAAVHRGRAGASGSPPVCRRRLPLVVSYVSGCGTVPRAPPPPVGNDPPWREKG